MHITFKISREALNKPNPVMASKVARSRWLTKSQSSGSPRPFVARDDRLVKCFPGILPIRIKSRAKYLKGFRSCICRSGAIIAVNRLKLPTLIFTCVRFLICLPFSLAQAGELNVTYGLGERKDAMSWAVATDLVGTPPNIMSELSWRNLRGWEHNFGLKYIGSAGWMAHADLQMARFDRGGQVQDSDYYYDNRNGEYSRSLNATRGSAAQDITLLIGRRFYMDENTTLAISPAIGLSRNISDLRNNNGVQVIPASGPYPNLDSRYRAQFSSLLAGAETRWWFAQPFGLDLKWHRHWFNYHAEADWNLRTDFQHPVSFYQDGHGVDNRWSLGLLTCLNKEWTMELAFGRRNGSMQNGLHVANLADGTRQSTLLRNVEWSSSSTSLVMHRTF